MSSMMTGCYDTRNIVFWKLKKDHTTAVDGSLFGRQLHRSGTKSFRLVGQGRKGDGEIERKSVNTMMIVCRPLKQHGIYL